MGKSGIRIMQAAVRDAAAILELQKIAYISEAEIHQDFTIPPLHQKIEEVIKEFDSRVFLKAVDGDQIIGSVRGSESDGTCYIGKLIVQPERQNQGIGSRLLVEIEGRFQKAKRYELFTGHRSDRNLYLYRKMGYVKFKEEQVSPKLTIVTLQKEREST